MEQQRPVFRAEKRKELIKEIKSMRKAGGTYEEIADFLNEVKADTLSGKGKWYTQTVHRILNK